MVVKSLPIQKKSIVNIALNSGDVWKCLIAICQSSFESKQKIIDLI